MVVVGAQISAIDVFTLVKITIIHIFLHCFYIFHCALPYDNASPTGLVRIVHYISIGDVLGMNTCTAFNHWQLLIVQVLI